MCKMVHISFSNVVHSILCSNLLLLIMNHTIRPESGYEVASCHLFIIIYLFFIHFALFHIVRVWREGGEGVG